MITERLRELVSALMLLTRLPVWRLHLPMPAQPSRAVWAYPLVGALIGAAGAAVFAAASHAALAPWVAALLALCTQMLLTGALHEDGLADMADGFGGGRDAARKLEIMRDSRVGSYGVLALIMAVALRAASLAASAAPAKAAASLIVAGTLGRAAMLAVLATAKPARADGLAASLARPPITATASGLAIALVASCGMLGAHRAILACGAALLGALLIRWLTLRQIGGQTGDVLGACAVMVETLVLLLLA